MLDRKQAPEENLYCYHHLIRLWFACNPEMALGGGMTILRRGGVGGGGGLVGTWESGSWAGKMARESSFRCVIEVPYRWCAVTG